MKIGIAVFIGLILMGCSTYPQTQKISLSKIDSKELGIQYRANFKTSGSYKRNIQFENEQNYSSNKEGLEYKSDQDKLINVKSGANLESILGQNVEPSSDIFNCIDFSSSESAQRYFILAGGPYKDASRLDADGDGFACEFDPRKYSIRSTTINNRGITSSSRCHWVSGYYRKNGTYVRGHRRCR